MYIWDYQIGKNWKPKTHEEWDWFLVRKINYGDLKGLNINSIKTHFRHIKTQLDPGKKILFEYYLRHL